MTLECYREISYGTLNHVEIAHNILKFKRYLTPMTVNDLQSVIDAGDDDFDASCSIDETLIELEEYIPPCCYIGAHPGDGALIGVWPNFEAASYDEDVLKVSDLSELNMSYTGLVLNINDHGNASLYEVWEYGTEDEVIKEIWGMV